MKNTYNNNKQALFNLHVELKPNHQDGRFSYCSIWTKYEAAGKQLILNNCKTLATVYKREAPKFEVKTASQVFTDFKNVEEAIECFKRV